MLSPPVERKIFSISQLTEKIKSILEESFPFIWITGEISNFKSPVSGHYYFTLKDDQAQISAIMFRGQNRNLKFLPEDGMKITGFGRISVYQPRGSYQIIIEYLEPAGVGALQAAFEQLKARLAAEGLFDEKHKSPLPFLPSKVYMITSPTGSVVHDMIRVLHRRIPNMKICIIPAKVQGDDSVDEIVSAISLLNTLEDADVAIIARGGGSLEDLNAFNSEKVARAVFASHVPIISAIGHETDFTITDFVSDLRAPTPSAAAELVVPVKEELMHRRNLLLKQLQARFGQYLRNRLNIIRNLTKHLTNPRKRLDDLALRLDDGLMRLTRSFKQSVLQNQQQLFWLSERLKKSSPRHRISTLRDLVSHRKEKLLQLMDTLININRLTVKESNGRLNALNPLSVLDRGFSITRTLPDKAIITDANTVSPGQLLEILLARGTLTCRVEKEKFDGKKDDI